MRERNFAKLAAILLALAVLTAPPAVASEISDSLRAELSAPLQKKVAELLKIKNDLGANNVRGSFYRTFNKVDDETYTVTFHTRTALPEQMKTERFLITLKKEGQEWKIADEKLQRTVDGVLFRSLPDDETAHAFDSFSFVREGMTLTAGKGTMIMDYWRGRPFNFRVEADSFNYDYEPPVGVPYSGSTHNIKKEMLPNEIVFPVARLDISCKHTDCEEILATSFKGLRDIGMDQADSGILNAYREANKQRREGRRDSPMAGYQLDSRPDRHQWRVALKRASARDHYGALSFDSHAPEEVRFWNSTNGTIYTYYSEETRNSGASPYDLELRPDSFALDFDLIGLDGDVEMAIEDADTMECDLSYTIRAKRAVQYLRFGIQQVRESLGEEKESKRPSFKVLEMVDGNGEDLTFTKTGSASGLIMLPEPLNAGDELQVDVTFVNTNSIYKLNPSYSYVSRGGWLPFVRFGDMIDDFSMRVSVPERYQILGVGHKIGEERKDGIRTAYFKAESAVTFPTVIFGDYITDAPKFKSTKIDGSDIPVNIYVDKTSTMLGSKVETRSDLRDRIAEDTAGIKETRGSSLRPLAEQAANSLNLYREVYGIDYPFGKLDLVNDPVGPGFYGQAPASIIYLGSGVFRGTGEVASFGGQNISRFQDSVVAHEVGHQWWGGLVTNANQRHYWFVESMAEYSSALYLESLFTQQKGLERGQKVYLNHVEDWRRNVMRANAMASVQDVDTMWQGEIPGLARQAAIYNQGPYAFHILRMTFGDEKFFAFLKKMANDLAGREITTRDIQNVAEQSFGGNMDWFFDQWIRGIGLPQYQLTVDSRRAEDGTYIVEGKVKQRIVAGPKKEVVEGQNYRGLVVLTVIGKNGEEFNVKLLVEDAETPFAFKVPDRPVDYALNKKGEILAHDVLVNQDW